MKCACGCGGVIIEQPHHKQYGTPKYINGHNWKGKTHTDETKEKLRDIHTGKKHTPQSIEKMRNVKSGENNPNYGSKRSEEFKQRISEVHLGRKHTDEAKENMRQAHLGKKQSAETINKRIKKGVNHYNWQGGISFAPYCPKFNNKFKEEIREMFNRECFICGKSEDENGQKHSVHHVNYDKSCLCDDLECKFVPLCIPCHAKTNHNRDYWERLILDKLNNITGEYHEN